MKILIADDDPIARRFLERRLVMWGYKVAVASDGNEALQILQQEDYPQIAILDWMMPGAKGIDVCHEVRKQKRERYIYMLLLTTKNQKEDIIKGLESGADDYITKPFNIHELELRLRAASRIIKLEEDLIAVRDQLRIRATHDALTGIMNRSAIFDALNREIFRAKREHIPLAVIIVDLDNFKKINDTYGHMAGDIVLREVVERIECSIRPYDAVGRFGGEEFLIVLPGCNTDNSRELMERLRKTVAEEEINVQEGSIHVTVSMGVAIMNKGEDAGTDLLIRTADKALYRAKHNGKNRVEFSLLQDSLQFGSMKDNSDPVPDSVC